MGGINNEGKYPGQRGTLEESVTKAHEMGCTQTQINARLRTRRPKLIVWEGIEISVSQAR
jgi:hypothetical protein